MVSRNLVNTLSNQVLHALLLTVFVISQSCSTKKEPFSVVPGEIWFRSETLSLKFDSDTRCSVYFGESNKPLNETAGTASNHTLIVNGVEVTGFQVLFDSITMDTVQTSFGKGRKLVIPALAEKEGAYRIMKILTVELYSNYPNSAITRVQYKNTGTLPFQVDKEISCRFTLNASVTDKNANPWEFWSFQGSALEWGKDYIIPIDSAFEQENEMGVQPVTKTGGGVPLIDLWTRHCGFSIAHVETKPQLVSFPVKADPLNGVTLALNRTANIVLNPGESYHTLKTVFTAHTLDFYEPLNTYSRLVADEGLKRPAFTDEAYEAIWCGWGYLTDFSLDDIYGTLPKLKELGITWVVIDDRWWDRYGDWNPRKSTFPGGEKQVKQFVDSLHNQGFKIQIWWAPTPVQPADGILSTVSVDPGMASVAKRHPEWLIMDQEGNYPRDCRGMLQFCPGVPEVRQHMKTLTERFIGKWGFDGHKLDAYYVVPPCYNPAHHHQRPDESYEDLPLLLKTIRETSKSIKPWSVTEICNCGTNQDFFQSIYCDQPVNSDPTSVVQSRQRVKVLKALWGPNAPVFTDHVEHIRPQGDMNDKSDTARVGDDFATSMGPGGVIGTKFTWPAGPENMQLKGEREQHWKKWFTLYNRKMLSKGNYLNLYDVVYDIPETHVIQKTDTLYYAFYAENWTGTLELRGLSKGRYRVWDYENQRSLGTVKGPAGKLNTTFKAHLLVECVPVY